jgi:hypothetical protein
MLIKALGAFAVKKETAENSHDIIKLTHKN